MYFRFLIKNRKLMQTVCYHSNSSKKHFNMNESRLFVRVLSDLRLNLHVPQRNVAMESYEFNCLERIEKLRTEFEKTILMEIPISKLNSTKTAVTNSVYKNHLSGSNGKWVCESER